MRPLLCINGSDSMGYAGIQADIRTAKDLGCYAVTAVTAVTVQNSMLVTITGKYEKILPINAVNT